MKIEDDGDGRKKNCLLPKLIWSQNACHQKHIIMLAQ